MMKIVLLISALIFLSFLLGFLLSETVSDFERKKTEILPFSVETRAVCEELKKKDCYYRCHDEVFLVIAGRRMSVHKSRQYVCHGKEWVDPRVIIKK